jgi:hypothetical protein
MRISVTERVVVTTCTRLDALQNSLRGRANHGHIGIIARIPKKQRRAKTLAVYCTAGPCLGKRRQKSWRTRPGYRKRFRFQDATVVFYLQ